MSFNREQIQNAAIIYSVGQSMGASTRDIQTALIAAMVESNLVNVHYGDRDSLGLFQQRPSQGWGSASQVMDPKYAAQKFFSSLFKVKGRSTMSMGRAAQAVQRSAYPDRYDKRTGDMQSIWPRITSAAGTPTMDMDGQPYGTTGKGNQPIVTEQQQPDLPPSAESMLGAWDTDSPEMMDTGQQQLKLPTPIINKATNQAIIQPLAQSMPGFEKGVDGWRKAVVEIAQRYLGTPYAWGGTQPGGFDCSGLIQYVYGKAGKNMPRISYQQANSGKRIKLGGLQPGDLVAWDNSSRNNGADHIAIYIGGGKIIEAPRPGLSVRIRSLGKNEGAWGVSLG